MPETLNDSGTPEQPINWGTGERLWYNGVLYSTRLENSFKKPEARKALIHPDDQRNPDIAWREREGEPYFRIHKVDETTYAIGEQNDQLNHSYVILGEGRAILFDAGVDEGVRAIAQEIAEQHGLELEVMFSHLHYDHLGGAQATRAMLPNLPSIRGKVDGNGLIRSENIHKFEHLGATEGIKPPDIEVSGWVDIGEEIDLGGRKLRMLYAPGHCWNHVVLWDKDRKQVFAADLAGTFPIYAMLPTSSVGDYIWTVDNLLKIVDEDTEILNTHRSEAHGGLPTQGRDDLLALRGLLKRVQSGELADERHLAVFNRFNSTRDGVSLIVPKAFKHPQRTTDLPSGIEE